MGWQEELRQLDQELAAGRVSSQDYRRRREELGAQATPFSWNNDEPTTRIPRADESRTRMRRDADATQIIRDEHADADPERTQVVPNFAVQAPRPQTPPMYPARSPWNEQELPPTTDVPPVWLRQGPEAFEPDNSTAKRVLGAVGVVVLLAWIATGAYFLFRPAGGTSSPPTTSTAATEPTQHSLIAQLPGKAQDSSSVKTFGDVRRLNYLTPGETDVYQAGGVDEAAMGLSGEGDSRVIVLVTRLPSAAKARATRDALADLQLAFKLTERDGEPGVRIAIKDGTKAGALRRAHYSSEGYVVRVQVQGQDVDGVQRLFDDVLRAQVRRLPADPAA